MMKILLGINRLLTAGVALVLLGLAAGGVVLMGGSTNRAKAEATPAPVAIEAAVAVVTPRDVSPSDEFSGRLEAVERVEIRSRVSGMIQEILFREGALVNKGDLLIRIDPALYAADVARAEGQVSAAQARVVLARSDFERGQQLFESRTVSQRDLDNRTNAFREAEANLRAAEAALQTARLNLEYTEVRAPVAGRIGKIEFTVGNLIVAGPTAPVLTTLVSLNPIYASFNADEEVVTRALAALADAPLPADTNRIPVEMTTSLSDAVHKGRIQFIDNQVDVRSGTVRVRAVFNNPDGRLMPGQFARLSMAQPKAGQALLISERAVGTDQNKKFVMVVDADSKAAYREVFLGPSVEGMRVVVSGLQAGERIVVNGLQRVRPGVLLAPQMVSMDGKQTAQAANSPLNASTQR
jgi:multidrug efflux system membrane fusion protein